jgi:hypothetical protein
MEKSKHGGPGWYFWQKYRRRHIVLYDDGRENEEQRRKLPGLFMRYELDLPEKKAFIHHLIQLREEVKAMKQLNDPNFRTHHVPIDEELSPQDIQYILNVRTAGWGEQVIHGFSALGYDLLKDIDANFEVWTRYTDDFDLLEGAWFDDGRWR